MNKVILMGRLTAEPDLKYSKNDSTLAIASYTIAVDDGYGDKKRTDFLRITAFGKAGEFASKYFHKGKRVLICGRIHIDKYTNKDGKDVYSTNIVADTQEFADSNPNGKNDNASSENNNNDIMQGFENIDGATDDDILPFT